nr:amino acid--tRNA ligase-related protein [Arhodomonas sp.]
MRLRHRYVDLRRPEMQRAPARPAARVTSAQCAAYLDAARASSTSRPRCSPVPRPEGARDFLRAEPLHAGVVYALPQSPQLFKQLLMMSGIDRYYQIVRCFRDEDLRADRQPEFTQLDIETSFVDEDGIMGHMEAMIRELFRQILDVELPDPFPRMRYAEAMDRFGIDRPDRRIPLELVEVADLVTDVDFKVFAGPANDPKGRVAALRVPGGGEAVAQGHRRLHRFRGALRGQGPGLHQGQRSGQGREGLQSPILKFLPDAAVDRHPGAHRRRGRRHRVLRRRQGQCGQRRARGAAGAPRATTSGLSTDWRSPVGGRLPDVRVRREGRSPLLPASPVHRAAGD